MTARDPLFVVGAGGAGQTSPTEARLAMAGLVAPDTGGVSARAGVFYGPGTPLSVTGTASMAYNVAAGQAAVNRASSALGVYVGANDATVSVSTTAAPGTAGTSRYDLIYIRFPDAEQGDGTSAATIGVVQGTAAASPTRPTGSVPAGALVLAEAQVFQGNTRTDTGVIITQTAPWTAAAGGILAIRSSTERAALTQYDGLTIFRTDTDRFEVSVGGSWLVACDPNAWASYTPTLTSSTGATPTTGTGGSITGSWTQQGKTVTVQGTLTFGTSPTVPGGDLRISLPVAAGSRVYLGQCFGSTSSNPNLFVGTCIAATGLSYISFQVPSASTIGDLNVLGNSSYPFAAITFASGNLLRFQITYEAA